MQQAIFVCLWHWVTERGPQFHVHIILNLLKNTFSCQEATAAEELSLKNKTNKYLGLYFRAGAKRCYDQVQVNWQFIWPQYFMPAPRLTISW